MGALGLKIELRQINNTESSPFTLKVLTLHSDALRGVRVHLRDMSGLDSCEVMRFAAGSSTLRSWGHTEKTQTYFILCLQSAHTPPFLSPSLRF